MNYAVSTPTAIKRIFVPEVTLGKRCIRIV